MNRAEQVEIKNKTINKACEERANGIFFCQELLFSSMYHSFHQMFPSCLLFCFAFISKTFTYKLEIYSAVVVTVVEFVLFDAVVEVTVAAPLPKVAFFAIRLPYWYCCYYHYCYYYYDYDEKNGDCCFDCGCDCCYFGEQAQVLSLFLHSLYL